MLESSATERWSDSACYRALGKGGDVRSILVLKLDHIGDFILSLDAQLHLRRSFPNATIDLVCGPWNVELAEATGIFDSIYDVAAFDPRADGSHPSLSPAMIAGLQGKCWDLAIDLRHDADTRFLLRYVEAKWKVGFDSPDGDEVMSLSLPRFDADRIDGTLGVNQSIVLLRLIHAVVDVFWPREYARSLLVNRLITDCGIDLTWAVGRHLVVCNTSSGREVKNWPLDRFKRLIAWLALNADCAVVLVGDEKQIDDAAEVVAFCQSDNVISIVGKTSIRAAMGVVAKASIYIGNDTALTHVAARMGVCTVALISGVDPPTHFAPLGRDVTILKSPVACSPCHIARLEHCRGARACMLNISESAVRAAVLRHLCAARVYDRNAEVGQGGANHHTGGEYKSDYKTWLESVQREVPQRYSQNHDRYLARGGQLNIQDLLRGFTKGNENNRGDLNRFYTLALVFDQISKEGLRGDIAELGVYKGNTAYMMAKLARSIGATAYLLDTFEGFAAGDLSGVDANKAMAFSDTSLEAVQTLVGTASVQFIKGYFPDSATQIPADATFCLVHIDCDLYAPFKAALNYFYERLVPGGYLIMHDYSSLHWDGAERAIDEFFSTKPESVVPVADGSGTVIVRKAKPADESDTWVVHQKTNGFANGWVHASSRPIESFLGNGWSEPEPWGTWGLGDRHALSLLFFEPPGVIELEVESQLALLPGRERAFVDVRVNDRPAARWDYDRSCNAALRRLCVSRDLMMPKGSGLFEVEVAFYPSSSESPHDVDPAIADTRPLGMGLIRFRQRSPDGHGRQAPVLTSLTATSIFT